MAARIFVSTNNEYLEMPSAVITAAPFTISFWFSPSSLTAGTMFSIANTATAHLFSIRMNISGTVDFRAQDGSLRIATTTNSFTANRWGHVFAVAASATDRSVWLNAQGLGTNVTSAVPTSLNVTAIGRRSSTGPGDYIDGSIANLAIWNTALTQFEGSRLFLGRAASNFRPTNLLLDLPLGEKLVESYRKYSFTSTGSAPNPSRAPRLLVRNL